MQDSSICLNSGQAYFDNWRQLSPMDNAILRVIETQGGEILQSEIAALLGVSDTASISRSIRKMVNLGLATSTRYGRTNSYTTIFFGSTDGERLTESVNGSLYVYDTNAINQIDMSEIMVMCEAFGIDPTKCQRFKNKQYENRLCATFNLINILKHHDSGDILARFRHWYSLLCDNELELSGLSPALVWVRIVEGGELPRKIDAKTPQETRKKGASFDTNTTESDTISEMLDDCELPVMQPSDECQDTNWQDGLDYIKSKAQITPEIYNYYFLPLRPIKVANGCYEVAAPEHARTGLNRVYLAMLEDALNAGVVVTYEQPQLRNQMDEF